MSVKVTMKMKKFKLMALVKIKITTERNKLVWYNRQLLFFQYLCSFVVKRSSRLISSFKDILKNKKKNMEQINYYKLQYDITRNKHFTMIARPGSSEHLSTLKDAIDVNKDVKYFVWITEDIPRNQTEIFEKYF